MNFDNKVIQTNNDGERVLLLIDGQFDFCNPTGSLFVNGADKDSTRLADAINKDIKFFDRIVATKDSHRAIHIAHGVWFKDKDGNHPDPFTLINAEDVVGPDAKWKATNPGFQKWTEDYVQKLADQGKYVLCIWPRHCLIGSNGHKIEPVLFDALLNWEDSNFATVDYINKGSNVLTEHYSAFKAEVEDPEDQEGTGPNMRLAELLGNAKTLYIAGQALSHCVLSTVADIADYFGDEYVKKFALVEDATSPVDQPMFHKAAEDFVNNMVGRGMKLVKTTNLSSVA